jgi:3-phosphoshikimate 1-carboxyvinyltransferase
MADFCFVGTLPASKSIMNRALLVQSFKPDIQIAGHSQAEDVENMRRALRSLQMGEKIDCGDAGTVFRFMALRASKLPGEYIITGTKRLLSRPHGELLKLLRQLGVEVELTNEGLRLRSVGWQPMGDGIWMAGKESSQVASGLFLSAWGLRTPLHLNISSEMVSEAYFLMTVAMLKVFGMEIFNHGTEWTIPAAQVPVAGSYIAEIDVSSAFAVSALAAVSGEARIRNFPEKSVQPDAIFTTYLHEMGIQVSQQGQELRISRANSWMGIDTNLKNSPDVFPILSVLCALAQTPSEITGIRHVSFKESDRLKKTLELIQKMGAQVEILSEDGVRIVPTQSRGAEIDFSPDRDHRMAMAAAVATRAGFKVNLKTPDVVRKSFPEFWQIAGGLQ